MPLKDTSNSRLATTAFVGGVLAFPFCVLSYGWDRFTHLGKESYAVMYRRKANARQPRATKALGSPRPGRRGAWRGGAHAVADALEKTR